MMEGMLAARRLVEVREARTSAVASRQIPTLSSTTRTCTPIEGVSGQP